MKTEYEIEQKCREMYSRALAERKEKYLTKSHLNCSFNMRCRVKQNGMVGFCTNQTIVDDTKRNFFVCNDERTAAECPLFKCAYTEASIKQELDDIIKDPARCGKEYPKLAVLLWVLQNSTLLNKH